MSLETHILKMKVAMPPKATNTHVNTIAAVLTFMLPNHRNHAE